MFGKRLFDFAIAGSAVLLTLPIWVLAALIIAVGNGGPIFYHQDRVGRFGKGFKIYKFRTMGGGIIGSSVTEKGDPRVFRGGNFLRRYKIDELPQLLNVLKGDMSLVGPRPTVQEDYARMNETQRTRATVPPGITGLAQISGNTSLSWNERIEYDLEYIREHSIWLDARILLRTLLMIVLGRAETHPRGKDEWE